MPELLKTTIGMSGTGLGFETGFRFTGTNVVGATVVGGVAATWCRGVADRVGLSAA
jgi:hypothetical protein